MLAVSFQRRLFLLPPIPFPLLEKVNRISFLATRSSEHTPNRSPSFKLEEERMKDLSLYWKKNLRFLAIILSIWFVVSYGCGILFVDALNTIKFGGFKLGFWFAQQGSIYVFIALIFIYVRWMNKLDKEFDVEE